MSPIAESRDLRQHAFEVKFLVPADRADAIRQWARERFGADPNGMGKGGDTYRTTSIYFDTDGFDVYRRNGSYGRSKYRVRRYCDGATVFLERKLKTRDLVSKRRSLVELGELERIAGAGVDKGWAGFWFHRRMVARALRPVCQISYERTAREEMTGNGPIRLTLDQDLRVALVASPEFQPPENALAIAAQSCILELKYRYAMPAVFKLLLAEFGLKSQPVSKYRIAMAALGCAAKETTPPVYA